MTDKKKNPFKDLIPLTTDWMCPTVIGREEQIDEIQQQIIDVLIKEKGVPQAMYAYGGSGSGKTFIYKKLFEKNYDEITRHIPNYDFLYINLKQEGIPSYYTVLSKINNYLKKYLPVFIDGEPTIRDIPVRGLGNREHKEIMEKIIKEKKLCIVIIIDEIDRLIEYEKSDDLMYAFSTLYEKFKDEMFVGMTPIFISNKIMLLQEIESKTRERIPYQLYFKPYMFDELYHILLEVAKYSLEDWAYDEDVIKQVAMEINDGSNSAREAKRLLYNMIKSKSLDEAIRKTEMDLMDDEIKSLSLHQKIALYAVVDAYKETQKKLNSPNSRHYRNKELTLTYAFDFYIKRCTQLNEKPKVYKSFTRMLQPLGKSGILRLDVKSYGRARGIATQIALGEDLQIIEPVITNEIKHLIFFEKATT